MYYGQFDTNKIEKFIIDNFSLKSYNIQKHHLLDKLSKESNKELFEFIRINNFIKFYIKYDKDTDLSITINFNSGIKRNFELSLEHSSFNSIVLYYQKSKMHFDSDSHFIEVIDGETKFTDYKFYSTIINFIKNISVQYYKLYPELKEADEIRDKWGI